MGTTDRRWSGRGIGRGRARLQLAALGLFVFGVLAPRSAAMVHPETMSAFFTTLALVSWDFQPLLDNPAFSKGLLLGLCRLVRDYRDAAS